MSKLSTYEKLTFEEAARIIYWQFSRNKQTFFSMMEELMDHYEDWHTLIAPAWYEQYREHLKQNLKE